MNARTFPIFLALFVFLPLLVLGIIIDSARAQPVPTPAECPACPVCPPVPACPLPCIGAETPPAPTPEAQEAIRKALDAIRAAEQKEQQMPLGPRE